MTLMVTLNHMCNVIHECHLDFSNMAIVNSSYFMFILFVWCFIFFIFLLFLYSCYENERLLSKTALTDVDAINCITVISNILII